jgi:hypothetical protein
VLPARLYVDCNRILAAMFGIPVCKTHLTANWTKARRVVAEVDHSSLRRSAAALRALKKNVDMFLIEA